MSDPLVTWLDDYKARLEEWSQREARRHRLIMRLWLVAIAFMLAGIVLQLIARVS